MTLPDSLIAVAAAPPSAKGGTAPAAYTEALADHVERLRATPAAPPGTVVVVTHRDRTVFARACGFRDLGRKAPMTLDTPVYNAPVTKAYTGLLAAMLDSEGRLKLDETPADVWPGLTLPASVDARPVTEVARIDRGHARLAEVRPLDPSWSPRRLAI